MVKVIFAAIDKSASWNFFRFENPEISAVCRPNFALRGGGQSARGIVFFAEKSIFFVLTCYLYPKERFKDDAS